MCEGRQYFAQVEVGVRRDLRELLGLSAPNQHVKGSDPVLMRLVSQYELHEHYATYRACHYR